MHPMKLEKGFSGTLIILLVFSEARSFIFEDNGHSCKKIFDGSNIDDQIPLKDHAKQIETCSTTTSVLFNSKSGLQVSQERRNTHVKQDVRKTEIRSHLNNRLMNSDGERISQRRDLASRRLDTVRDPSRNSEVRQSSSENRNSRRSGHSNTLAHRNGIDRNSIGVKAQNNLHFERLKTRSVDTNRLVEIGRLHRFGNDNRQRQNYAAGIRNRLSQINRSDIIERISEGNTGRQDSLRMIRNTPNNQLHSSRVSRLSRSQRNDRSEDYIRRTMDTSSERRYNSIDSSLTRPEGRQRRGDDNRQQNNHRVLRSSLTDQRDSRASKIFRSREVVKNYFINYERGNSRILKSNSDIQRNHQKVSGENKPEGVERTHSAEDDRRQKHNRMGRNTLTERRQNSRTLRISRSEETEKKDSTRLTSDSRRQDNMMRNSATDGQVNFGVRRTFRSADVESSNRRQQNLRSVRNALSDLRLSHASPISRFDRTARTHSVRSNGNDRRQENLIRNIPTDRRNNNGISESRLAERSERTNSIRSRSSRRQQENLSDIRNSLNDQRDSRVSFSRRSARVHLSHSDRSDMRQEDFRIISTDRDHSKFPRSFQDVETRRSRSLLSDGENRRLVDLKIRMIRKSIDDLENLHRRTIRTVRNLKLGILEDSRMSVEPRKMLNRIRTSEKNPNMNRQRQNVVGSSRSMTDITRHKRSNEMTDRFSPISRTDQGVKSESKRMIRGSRDNRRITQRVAEKTSRKSDGGERRPVRHISDPNIQNNERISGTNKGIFLRRESYIVSHNRADVRRVQNEERNVIDHRISPDVYQRSKVMEEDNQIVSPFFRIIQVTLATIMLGQLILSKSHNEKNGLLSTLTGKALKSF